MTDTAPVSPAKRVDPDFTASCEAICKRDGAKAALAHMFREMCNTRYIAEERLQLNINFPIAPSTPEFGRAVGLEISINCSKPEIAAGITRKPTPLAPGAACVLCPQNVGFKPGLRAWGLEIGGREFFMQCPPYPYCDLHTVLIETLHTPQKISCQTLVDLTDAATKLEGMYVCSNTDLSGTGASVLQHKHYQLVAKRLPIHNAKVCFSAEIPSICSVKVYMLDFPVAAVKIVSASVTDMIEATDRLLNSWRSPTMATAIGSKIEEQTASFICSYDAQVGYDLIMIPRTQPSCTRELMKCIKSEFVGILEMAGFGILPGRLKSELARLIFKGEAPEGDTLGKYAAWMKELNVNCDKESDTLQESLSANLALYKSFVAILEDNSAFDSSDQALALKWIVDLSGFSVSDCVAL